MIKTAERLRVLGVAVTIARSRGNYELVHRFDQAILDVVCNTVLDRTHRALEQAWELTA